MKIPCEGCISLAVCKQKEQVRCQIVDDFVFLHDHDPGFEGARARGKYVAEQLFRTEDYVSLIDPINRVVILRNKS